MSKLNKKDIARAYAAMYHCPITVGEFTVESVAAVLADIIYERGEDVHINGLGTFYHKVCPARTFRVPGEDRVVETPERIMVKFRPAEHGTPTGNKDDDDDIGDIII